MENTKRPAETEEELTEPRQSTEDQPDGGPTMSVAGAMPAGSEMSHWKTAYARPDATRPETMPGTVSTPEPGEKNHSSREKV